MKGYFGGNGMKGQDGRRCAGAFAHIMKVTAANALLFAIALGLFLALGLRDGGAASMASAEPLGFTGGLRVNTAVYRGRKGEKAALLIAASWDASALEDIAETLEKTGARATFALSREVLYERPQLASRLAASGHELAAAIGDNAEEKGLSELINELESAIKLIEAAAGERPRLVYAGRSDALINASKRLGLTAVKGSIDLICERGTAEQILKRARGNFSGGDIIVCSPTAAFSEALSGILKYFSDSGLTAATVSGTIYD